MGKEDIRTEMSANMSTNMSKPASPKDRRKPERMWVTITKKRYLELLLLQQDNIRLRLEVQALHDAQKPSFWHRIFRRR